MNDNGQSERSDPPGAGDDGDVVDRPDGVERDADADAYRTSFEESESVAGAIVEAVAAATGSDPMELSPLYTVLDPDALDALLGSATGPSSDDLSLTFRYEGCEIAVYSHGVVRAEPSQTDE